MNDFLKSAAGQAVFGAVIAVLLIIFLDVNYKIFAKAAFDFVFAFLCTLICSPALLICAVISKARVGQTCERVPYIGAKGKIIYVRSFAGINRRIKYLPRILDVLCGRLSFVGVKLMQLSDGALMEDNQMERFAARPGLVCHLVLKDDENLTYEEMFALDVRYAKRRELFTDIYIVLKYFVLLIRGEGKSFFGEARNKSYGEILLERGEITEQDLQSATACGEEALEEHAKRSEFKKQRYG